MTTPFEEEARKVAHSVKPMDFGSTEAIKLFADALRLAYRKGVEEERERAIKWVELYFDSLKEKWPEILKAIRKEEIGK